jgi:hypothetical protein
MLTAAEELASSSFAVLTWLPDRAELVGYTDRLLGWAQAYHELGALGQLRGA